jgi:CheY-like chemotaxis protein
VIAQILIADDNREIRLLLADYLGGKNHRVIVVEDGYQLVQKAHEYRPHLIISDIMMPGSYGTSSYEILQKDSFTASIPVIFISANAVETVRPLLPDNPKTRFLQKPISLPDLERVISELLPMGGYVP